MRGTVPIGFEVIEAQLEKNGYSVSWFDKCVVRLFVHANQECFNPRRTHLSCTTLKKYLLDYDHSIGGWVAEMLPMLPCRGLNLSKGELVNGYFMQGISLRTLSHSIGINFLSF